ITESGTSSLASAASARVAAISISPLIFLARTSSAPRKMKGKPSTLFTWFGKSERPVAMIASGRACRASSGMISGVGFASPNTIGRRPRPREHHLDRAGVLVHQLQRVQQRRARDDRRAVLVVVEHRDRQRLAQRLLDVETVGGADVLEVDAAHGRLEQLAESDHVLG